MQRTERERDGRMWWHWRKEEKEGGWVGTVRGRKRGLDSG